jgi:chromosome segregation ATPase
MNDIIGYLQTFPAEITGHLNSIANKIEVTDENLIDNLRAQIETLQNEKAALVTKQEDIMKEVDGFMEEIDELTRAQKDWQKKEMDLSAEVQRLNTQLEEVGRNLNYNKHHIYRQRNFILDEVDRMINAPTWTFKQNSVNHRQTIESKLDEIMNEIGIDGNE